MAQFRLDPPAAFNFRTPEEWPRWKSRFDQYRTASGLTETPELQQVNTLLYCLGEEADSVLSSTDISEGDRKKYGRVIEKFDAFFKVRQNVIYERARFSTHCKMALLLYRLREPITANLDQLFQYLLAVWICILSGSNTEQSH